MGLHNRPYWRDRDPESGSDTWQGGPLRLYLPKPGPVVLVLMGVCFAVFLVNTFMEPQTRIKVFLTLGLVFPDAAEVWRFLTFQFLHGHARHIMWNLVGLYFFGPPLEKQWGRRRFLAFYLVCGAFAGACYLLMCIIWPQFEDVPLVGASGGVLACLMACAILFPSMRVIVIPIRWVAFFYAVLYLLSIAHDRNLADGAHLGGMLAAALWIWLFPKVARAGAQAHGRLQKGAWDKKMKAQARERAEVDRILQKIHDEGINSLTRREKKLLQDATRQQQKEEREIYRA
ncbi:MAG: Rhomboid protease GlpG [Planctomycetes bacterium ADurb.Bin126]|nr:MAG: Rhomboid protease GlpG [Planctomycetes bacterium ADurb.Bin126]HOD81596.1 rhomboid family intramembrane serine protease [Phycisphaerae bacterium]HQL71851.1 rhomboid family intramembrane serine protease [Phycisphaerae bacterium]